jgi:exodeoxyribonuclease-3
LRIISWNINGIRACIKKGFRDYLENEDWDILGMQEVRALPEQMPEDFVNPPTHQAIYRAAEKKGYSGVGLFSKPTVKEYWFDLGEEEFDREGRVIAADYTEFVLFNVYFPNGSGARDNSRVPYKMAFYERLLEEIDGLRARGREVIVMGDFNTAHQAIDLARPAGNKKTSGFLIEERDEFTRWLDTGLVDSFRHIHGDEPEHYSWWSNRSGARERNVGWRIDYVLMTPGLLPRLQSAEIHPKVLGSDHCPISIVLAD